MLTYRTAATKAVVHEKPREATASSTEPRLSVEERLTKAFAGLCSLNELSAMNLDGIIKKAEYDHLLAERRYIDEISPFERSTVQGHSGLFPDFQLGASKTSR